MIDQLEADELIKNFIIKRERFASSPTKKNQRAFELHEKLCMEKFAYLVTMRTQRYKGFSNYDDLNQEGFEALIKSMKNYDPSKGSFFWWAHKYIDTRIARSANLHTAIRYPLKVARAVAPHKESKFPIMIEPRFNPDKILESNQLNFAMKRALDTLTPIQRNVLSLAYGFEGDKPLSINKICKKLSMSRLNCIKTMNLAVETIKQNIKL